ncbi:MAG TPA: hypothetical protein DC017_16070 [Candidatus Wallbacteria bacterium]|nr:hypothetical protein [Candidatus Wallbacteria bacterium]
MKPVAIVKDIFFALVLAAMMYLINCVEPLPAAISSILTGAVTAKIALVLISAGFVIHLMASLLLKRIGGKYYGLSCLLRRY